MICVRVSFKTPLRSVLRFRLRKCLYCCNWSHLKCPWKAKISAPSLTQSTKNWSHLEWFMNVLLVVVCNIPRMPMGYSAFIKLVFLKGGEQDCCFWNCMLTEMSSIWWGIEGFSMTLVWSMQTYNEIKCLWASISSKLKGCCFSYSTTGRFHELTVLSLCWLIFCWMDFLFTFYDCNDSEPKSFV